MYKFILTINLLATTFVTVFAQNHDGKFGNEWINYSQSYFKMQVSEDGLYRITPNALQQAGIDASQLNNNNVQLFCMGKEVPVFVQMNGTTLTSIEFYGKKNRGELDVNLYRDFNHHFNKEYSVISDTAAYFLTWNNAATSNNFQNRSADLSNLPAKEAYFMHTAKTVLNSNWSAGKEYQISTAVLSKSTFEFGEGYGSEKSTNHNIALTLANIYPNGPTATASVRVNSINNSYHDLRFKIGNNLLHTSLFDVENVTTYTFNVPNNLLQNTTTLNISGNLGASDLHSISTASITYPRSFNFGGASSFYFQMPASSTRVFLEITNFDGTGANAQTIYLYDLTNGVRINCFWDGSKVMTDLAPSATQRELVLVNHATGCKTIGRLNRVQFNNYQNTDANYIIISHASLFRNSAGINPVLEYAAYRASTGFNPIVIDVQDLFDQFAYGINMHPVSIRNFAAFAKANWSNPQYVFLIGKGRIYSNVRSFNTYDHLVPTFGFPPSDNLLLSPIGFDTPIIPVGRLAATSGDQVSLYLQKIKDLESVRNSAPTFAERRWLKNTIHASGGANSSEVSLFRQYLLGLEPILENTGIGSKVDAFSKLMNDPIMGSQSAYLDSLISNGVSLITFLGHATPNGFDYNVGRPEAWRNYKRYPMFMPLGCYVGTTFEDGMKTSETFIFEPNAGASVFLAGVSATTLSAVNVFTQHFYTALANDYYGQGAAKLVQVAIQNSEMGLGYPTTSQMVSHYMNYHGDPAFNFNLHAHPDYYIDQNLVKVVQPNVTVQMKSFEIEVDVHNLGRAVDAMISIEVVREFPDGATSVVSRQQFQAPKYNSTVSILIPVGEEKALGLNYLTIRVDADNQINEGGDAYEQNNIVHRFPVTVSSNVVLPIYPINYGIVKNSSIKLKAATGDLNAPLQNYRLQLDTTELFNSAFKKEILISQKGGVIEWAPNVSLTENMVYYWRISPDSINPESPFYWENSSFVYLNGTESGWNQSHIGQIKSASLDYMVLNQATKQFSYVNSLNELTVTNGFTPNVLHPEQLATYFNGNLLDKCRCSSKNGLYVQVVDSSSLNVWTLPGGTSRYGAINCDAANRTTPMFLFETNNPNVHAKLESFLRDSIPAGSYVLMFSLNDADADNWPASLTDLIQSYGSTQIQNLAAEAGGLPWAFYFQKDNQAFSYRKEALGQTRNDIVTISGMMYGSWDNGKVQSVHIGPAKSWKSLNWQYSSTDATPTDVVYVNVYGIDTLGVRSVLAPSVSAFAFDLETIDAKIYPNLQLELVSSDITNKTAPQLDYWRVFADWAPELSIVNDQNSSTVADTIQQGAVLYYDFLMENLGDTDMDSVLVRYTLIGSNQMEYVRLAPLAAGDTMRSMPIVIPTLELEGNQQILVEVNPNNDQIEQFRFNDASIYKFFVARDNKNPIIDVSFNGTRIMNGDIISANSMVTVSLTDENQLLSLDKLEDFNIRLRHSGLPNGEIRVSPNAKYIEDVAFVPADLTRTGSENKAKLDFKLNLELDGKYTFVAEAKDKSGNSSKSFTVDFEVVNKQMISNVLNYPNPFTTQTQFVFTLTGRDVPEYMKIQIMTVTGKIVREIGLDELGPLQIGTNRTAFAWDGTDAYGDRLANGTYLYRVIAKSKRTDADDIATLANSTSDLFSNGFGKMYLMR